MNAGKLTALLAALVTIHKLMDKNVQALEFVKMVLVVVTVSVTVL